MLRRQNIDNLNLYRKRPNVRIYDFGFYLFLFFIRIWKTWSDSWQSSIVAAHFKCCSRKKKDGVKERTAVNFYILLAGRFLTRLNSSSNSADFQTRDLKLNFITLKLRKMIRLGTDSQGELQPDTFSITLPVRYNVFRFNVI